MRPSIEALVEELMTIRMEEALAEAPLIFSDTETLQVLVDVTTSMEEAFAQEQWEDVPNLQEEVNNFLELHQLEQENAQIISKALLEMQISINLEVIAHMRKAYQEAHNQTYFEERRDHLHSLLSDKNPFDEH